MQLCCRVGAQPVQPGPRVSQAASLGRGAGHLPASAGAGALQSVHVCSACAHASLAGMYQSCSACSCSDIEHASVQKCQTSAAKLAACRASTSAALALMHHSQARTHRTATAAAQRTSVHHAVLLGAAAAHSCQRSAAASTLLSLLVSWAMLCIVQGFDQPSLCERRLEQAPHHCKAFIRCRAT